MSEDALAEAWQDLCHSLGILVKVARDYDDWGELTDLERKLAELDGAEEAAKNAARNLALAMVELVGDYVSVGTIPTSEGLTPMAEVDGPAASKIVEEVCQ